MAIPKIHTIRKLVITLFLTLLLGYIQSAYSQESSQLSSNSPTLQKLVVLDFEITGESGSTGVKEHDRLTVSKFSNYFRNRIQEEELFSVINDEESLAYIQDVSEKNYLHHCNGCELDMAKHLNADLVLVPWVFRMSHLVETMHIEIRDVMSGHLLMKRAYDFRGDNDKAWKRAIKYVINDLKESQQ